MVHDLSELNEINRLLITRYQEHEDRKADLDDEENSRSSRDRRRYTDQIERLEQQLEDLRLEYEVASSELHRLRRDRDDFHDEAKATEAGLQRQQGEVAQREGVITRLTKQVEKMRGGSANLRIKLHELRDQRTASRKEVQELRATLEDRDSGLESMRVMLENRNDEVAAMEERVTHTREARDSLQLRHNEAVRTLGTTQQELAEARSANTRAQEAETLKDRQLATLREEQLQKDREIEATARETHLRFQVHMEVQRQLMLPPTTTPAYSSSSMHNQMAFPPLTPASGMSTQELRVPTTYQAGSHTDQRGTPVGTNALNAMYASSEDRHPRQRSGSKDRHHRDRGSSDDRHRR